MKQAQEILCFSSTDWFGLWGSRQQIMRRLAARGHRVLFVERPIGLEHWLRYGEWRERKAQRWREGLREVEPGVHIASLPLLLPGRYYSPRINWINQQITMRSTRRYLAQLGMESPLLWIYNPFQGELVGKFGEPLSVYHCIDEWTAGTSGHKRAVIRNLEIELMRRVDLVIANSPPTFDEKRQFNAHTYRVPSGMDFEHFAGGAAGHNRDPDPVPPMLEKIPAPRIGYSGLVNDRLDYDVLETIARTRPNWSLVLIGSPHPWTMEAAPLQRLAAYPNVHFLGKRPYAEMPGLLRGIDVCLMPYINDDRGHYRSPLKLYEYLAAGKPVVSTPQPEADEFAGLVHQAADPHDFLRDVEVALTENSHEHVAQRIAVASHHSWDARVDELETIVANSLARQNG